MQKNELIEGRRTMRLAVETTVGNVLSLIFMACLVNAKGLVNPVFLQKVKETFVGDEEFIYLLFADLNKWFLLVFALALLIETGTVWYWTMKFQKK